MTPLENVLSKFPHARRSGKDWTAHCPAHEDRTPSLSISEGDDGRVLLFCHVGCTTEKILSAIHLEVSDLFEPNMSATPRSAAAAPRAPQFATGNEALKSLESQKGK